MENACRNDLPLVSVIVPTVKNDPYIGGCLKSLELSTYTNTENIVINEGLERSAQRNIGITKSSGKYLFIMDADMRVSEGLIWDCVIRCENDKKVVGVYAPEVITTKGWFGKYRNWERQFYTGTLIDVARFVRKSKCELFDETLNGPEDSDWERRIDGERATSTFPYYHQDDIGFWGYLKKKMYYAKSMKKYHEKNPQDKLLTFRYRCWTVFTENGKWKELIKHPIYTLTLIALLFIRGIIYEIAVSSE